MAQRLMIVCALAFACKGTGNVNTDGTADLDSDHGAGDHVGEDDPGSGDAVGLYRVVAEAMGNDVMVGTERMFETDFGVEVWDDGGQRIERATVTMETNEFGEVPLIEEEPGRYRRAGFGYGRTFTLRIDGPDGVFEATAVGPGIHLLDLGTQPLDVSQAVTVTWDPSGATFAEIDSDGTGRMDIPDTGSYTFGVGELDTEQDEVGEEDIDLRRWEVLNLTNAAPDSTFTVSIETGERDVDTFDSTDGEPGTGMVEGAVDIDGDLDWWTGSGTVYVLAWPDRDDPDTDAYSAWTTLEDMNVDSEADFTLGPLAEGDWFLRAYLDVDGSDDGASTPSGPTSGDFFEERDVTVQANQTVTRDLTLQEIW
jgi:hypothetical protein